MTFVRLLLLSLCAVFLFGQKKPEPHVAPVYAAASIVNAADNQPGALAPNTIGTIYGSNLAFSTSALTQNDITGDLLPTVLGSSETRVLISNFPANLYYVSPTQINFLVPPNLLAQATQIQVVIDSLAGPAIPVTLGETAPGLFQLDAQNAVATQVDGTVLTSSAPAKPGDTVILYATGLGQVSPPLIYGQLPTVAASLASPTSLSVLLNGAAVDQSAITYAGIAPFYAGLYQINLKLPESVGANPAIQLQIGATISASGIHLPVSASQ